MKMVMLSNGMHQKLHQKKWKRISKNYCKKSVKRPNCPDKLKQTIFRGALCHIDGLLKTSRGQALGARHNSTYIPSPPVIKKVTRSYSFVTLYYLAYIF